MSGIEQFVAAGSTEYSLAVVNRTSPRPLQTVLETMFAEQSVDVDAVSVPDGATDVVALLRNGDAVAVSPMAALERSVLMVNSDLSVTGTRGLDDVEVPAVLRELDDVRFTVRGYPDSHREKLLLITISRFVERLAWEGDGGTLRSSFQRLSRLRDERGTETVYERLTDTDTDVHVYGRADWLPPRSVRDVVHAGDSPDFRRGWFVVYTPDGDPEHAEGECAALVAYETGDNEWDGSWTRRPDAVAAVEDYVQRTM